MNDNERRPAPPPHGDPHHDGHHDHKKKKRGPKRIGIILFLVLIIVILVALIWFFRDGLGFGKGNGDDSGNSGSNSSNISDTNSDFVSDVTEIRIEQNDIYLGSEKCADTNELKEKITSAGSGKKYKLEHKTAIEDTYNEVKKVLVELRDALNLEIDFNE